MQTVIIVPLCTLSRSQHVGGTRSCLRRINGPHCPMNLVPRLYSLPLSFPPSLPLFREKRYLLTQQICSQRFRCTYIPPSSTIYLFFFLFTIAFQKMFLRCSCCTTLSFPPPQFYYWRAELLKVGSCFPVTWGTFLSLVSYWCFWQTVDSCDKNIAVWQLRGK